jgi:hypothetical protein
MTPRHSDAELERLAQESAAVRILRWAFLALDAATTSSTIARAMPRFLGLRTAGLILLIAAVTHAGIITFVPATLAPAGRYLFAAIGLVAGALLLVIDRMKR